MSDSLGGVFVDVQARTDKLRQGFNEAQRESERRAKGIESTFKNAKLTMNGEPSKRALESIQTKADDVTGAISNKFKIAGAMIGAALVTGLALIVRKTLEVTQSFQDVKARLESLYGSTERAAQVFERFQRVAATTPYSLREVANAGATLKAFGVDAEKNIKPVADLAAFMGVSIPEAASAWGRAFAGGAGAADIFRERGVLTLIKSFKGVEDLTKLTLPEFRQAMEDTFSDKSSGIAGATDRLSKNLSGKISNMFDAMEARMNQFGEAIAPTLTGIIESITEIMSVESLTDTFDKLSEKVKRNADDIAPLIVRYDVLSTKQTRSAEENTELSKVITDLAAAFPNAITQWDEYGKAIGISTDKIWDNIKAEQERLKYINAAAIADEKRTQQTIKSAMARREREIASGEKIVLGGPSGDIPMTAPLSDGDIARMQAEVEALGEQLRGSEAELRRLQGEVQTPYGPARPDDLSPDVVDGDMVNKRLAALRAVKEARMRLAREAIENEHAREVQAIEDRRTLRLQAVADEASKAKADAQTIAAMRLEVETDYQADRTALARKTEDEINKIRGPYGPEVPGDAYGPARPDMGEVWMDNNQALVDGLRGATGDMSSMWAQNIDEMLAGTRNFGEGVKGMWTGIASAVTAQIARMAAEWLAFQALTAFLSIFSGGATGAVGAGIGSNLKGHTGGVFVGGPRGITKMAAGGSFIVPPGFNRDRYPLMVESGERVSVTPSGQMQREGYDFTRIERGIQALNMNMVSGRGKPERIDIGLTGDLYGQDIQLAARKAERVYTRIH